MRVGIGYDVHRFMNRLEADRKLILGGVQIPCDMGLLGHSDADVLTHAVMDALLGAAGLPDIGCLFPDTDAMYKDACSIGLLKEVGLLLRKHNYKVENIDSVIIAEKPRLSPYYGEMSERIAGALWLMPGAVGVKATTEEGLGCAGLGIAAKAVCLIRRDY